MPLTSSRYTWTRQQLEADAIRKGRRDTLAISLWFAFCFGLVGLLVVNF